MPSLQTPHSGEGGYHSPYPTPIVSAIRRLRRLYTVALSALNLAPKCKSWIRLCNEIYIFS